MRTIPKYLPNPKIKKNSLFIYIYKIKPQKNNKTQINKINQHIR